MTGTRVQIPAYTDRWMMGDRYGTVIKTSYKTYKGGTGPNTARARFLVDNRPIEIATVRLDISGRTVRVILADCEVV